MSVLAQTKLDKQAFVFVTHLCSKEIIREFSKIRKAAEGIGDAFIAYHQKPGNFVDPAIMTLPHFFFSDEKISELGEAEAFRAPIRHASPANMDMVIMLFAEEHKYDYYWYIENDVRFTGDWKILFDHFARSKDDFISSHIRKYEEEPQWDFWHTLKKGEENPGAIEMIRSFNPIFRISRRALKYVYDRYLEGWSGHNETLLPSLLYKGGFTIRDFGGIGSFVRVEDKNKFYIDSSSHNLMDGTHRFHNKHVWLFNKPRNKIVHPVKSGIKSRRSKKLLKLFILDKNSWKTVGQRLGIFK